MASQPVSHVPPEDYLAFERAAETKHEYIDGEIVAMAGGSPKHGLPALNTAAQFRLRAAGGSCIPFNSDVRVAVQWDRLITYPDVFVVCGEVQYTDERRDTITNPKVIVEVLSPSTRNYDRGAKSYLYRQLPSLAEYLLIEHDAPEVETYRRLPNNHWEIETVRGLDATVRIECLGWDLPLAEIYRDTERL